MRKLLLAAALAVSTSVCAEALVFVAKNNAGDRYEIDVESYSMQDNVITAFVYQFKEGRRIQYMVGTRPVACETGSGYLMVALTPVRAEFTQTYRWDTSGGKIYDAEAKMLCRVHAAVLEEARNGDAGAQSRIR
jgi:hypothetical protein